MPDTVAGLPYPVGTDELRLGADALEELARALAPVTLEDASTMTSGGSWQVLSFTQYRAGLLTHIVGTVKRTGTALTVPANGNVGNQDVGHITSGFGGGDGAQKPYATTAIGSGSTGRLAQWNITPAGEIVLCSVATASDIAVDEVLSFNGVYIAATLTNTD